MIDGIEIENFQSWKECELDFHPGFNLIIGESNMGKSAIIRALELAATNRPSGKAFINWDANKAPATVVIHKDDKSVARIKGKTIDEYWLDGIEYKALRGAVPEDIERFLNLGPINMHKQKDGFFLFDKSAGEVGRYLNKIVELDIIDQSLAHAGKRVKEFERSKELLEQDVAEMETVLADSSWIDKADIKVIVIETKYGKLERVKLRKGTLQTMINQHERINEQLKKVLPFKDSLNRFKSTLKKYDAMQAAYIKSAKLRATLNTKAEETKAQDNFLKLAKLKPRIVAILVKDSKAQALQDKADKLDSLIKSIKSKKGEWYKMEMKAKELHADFTEAMPDVCPLCKTDLKEVVP